MANWALTPETATGSWQKKYLNPATSEAEARKLYKTWGTRYNWAPYEEVLKARQPAGAPAAAAAPAAPPDTSANYPYRAAFGGKLEQPDVTASNKIGTISSYMQPYVESPIYKYEREKGMESLNKLYAKRGLLGSGAEIAGNQEFLNALAAQEGQRAADLAAADQSTYAKSQIADALQRAGLYGTNLGALEGEATRLTGVQESEANRLERQQAQAWSNLFNLMNFYAGQNPMSQAYGATSAAGQGLTQGGSLYSPIMPTYISPQSSINAASSGNTGWMNAMNTISQYLGSLFGGK